MPEPPTPPEPTTSPEPVEGPPTTSPEPVEGPRSAVVITVSTRAASGVYPDRSGPVLADGLREAGFEVTGPEVVADGEPVAAALRAALRRRPAVVITTGGTGLAPDDRTPEMTRRVLETEIPPLAAAIARYGADHGVPTAVLSRGVAGTAGSTLIVNLPGSTGGVRDGLTVLLPVLEHAIGQLRGSDHPGSVGLTAACDAASATASADTEDARGH